VRARVVTGLIDSDVMRRDRAEHLQDAPDPRLGIGLLAAALDREHRSGRAHPIGQRHDLMRQRLRAVPEPVEDVGEPGRVDGPEAPLELRELGLAVGGWRGDGKPRF
jgi:hypothetical protein